MNNYESSTFFSNKNQSYICVYRKHVQEKAMRMAHDTSDMEMERSSICPVKGEQQDASEECRDAKPRLLGETSTAENQTGDAQGREDQQTTSTTN